MRIAGVGLLTGWGPGVGSLPADARAAAAGRHLLTIPPPSLAGDRYRRVTRECLLGIAAVEALLTTLDRPRAALAGSKTALLYTTASAYAASNRLFIEGGGRALHFPYTAPSAVPAEVAIEYQLSGAYLIFLGGAAATIDALWYAGTLLERGECDQALVLAVETFEATADLYAQARWLLDEPLVEAAACALLLPGGPRYVYAARGGSAPPDAISPRVGETLACAPLIALATAADPIRLQGRWRGRLATLCVEDSGAAVGGADF